MWSVNKIVAVLAAQKNPIVSSSNVALEVSFHKPLFVGSTIRVLVRKLNESELQFAGYVIEPFKKQPSENIPVEKPYICGRIVGANTKE
jgi:hypothetical protein